MVAERDMPAVRLTEPKWSTLLRSTQPSSISSGDRLVSAPRMKRKDRSPPGETETTAKEVGERSVCRPVTSTPCSASTRRR